jgi:beta-galactosidase/beta-glucuronidase
MTLREEIDLGGSWKFYPAFEPFTGDLRWMDPDFDPKKPDSLPEERRAGWTGEFFDDQGWLDIEVPGSWNASFEDLWSYEGHGWYRRRISVPAAWRGRRVVLHSDGANYRTELFVNGRLAGSHDGGHVPFSIPVGHLIEFGRENILAIDCDNSPRPDRVPGGQYGWWNHGGLYRDVRLLSMDPTHIDGVSISHGIEGGVASLEAKVSIDAPGDKRVDGQLAARLAGPGGKEIPLPGDAATVSLFGSGRLEARMDLTIHDPAMWSPESPNLYTISLELRSGGAVLDKMSSRFGLRTVRVEGDRLLLNGEPILIKGLNRHEQYPSGARSTATQTESQLQHDLDRVKNLGANALRCHYPNHPRLYELCDEMGILNIVEMPLWQWGSSLVDTDSPEAIETARGMMKEIIATYRSHPSIIIWSVSNENFTVPHSSQRDDQAAIELSDKVAEGNRELMGLAREMDPTRPVIEVSNHWPEDPAMGSGDILAVNAYTGSPSPPLKSQVGQTYRQIHDKLQALRQRHPGKPILVTEFGKWTVRGLKTDYPPGEAYQAEKLKAEWEGFLGEPAFAGAFIWSFADYDVHGRYRYTHEYRLGYGIYDLKRHPKAAVETIRSMWAE